VENKLLEVAVEAVKPQERKRKSKKKKK